MDRNLALAQLLKIERRVADGARDIANHRERIERLRRAGRDSTLAEAVFKRCEQAQDLNVALGSASKGLSADRGASAVAIS